MTDREKFEALIKSKFDNLVSLSRAANGDGEYCNWDAQVAWFAYQSALASQQPADEGWIEWNGGECPVGKNQGVEVKLRGGYGDQFYDNAASYFEWSHNGLGMDIIAYRVVKP